MLVRVKRQPLRPTRMMRPLLWMCVAFYMGYHVFHGERGLYALMRDRAELALLQADMEKTKAEREKIELRVRHLRSASLDRDLLDEQMRRMMGVMGQGEVVVLGGAD